MSRACEHKRHVRERRRRREREKWGRDWGRRGKRKKEKERCSILLWTSPPLSTVFSLRSKNLRQRKPPRALVACLRDSFGNVSLEPEIYCHNEEAGLGYKILLFWSSASSSFFSRPACPFSLSLLLFLSLSLYLPLARSFALVQLSGLTKSLLSLCAKFCFFSRDTPPRFRYTDCSQVIPYI